MRACIQGISPEWFTLSGEEDQDDPVQFYIKPLDGFGRTDIAMLSMSARSGANNAGIVASGEVIKTAFKLGVRGWKNITDPSNSSEQLKFSISAMNSLHPGWILEVGARVLQLSELGVSQTKNSD